MIDLKSFLASGQDRVESASDPAALVANQPFRARAKGETVKVGDVLIYGSPNHLIAERIMGWADMSLPERRPMGMTLYEAVLTPI